MFHVANSFSIKISVMVKRTGGHRMVCWLCVGLGTTRMPSPITPTASKSGLCAEPYAVGFSK